MIEFFTEGVDMPDLDYKKVTEWIGSVAQSHGFLAGNITYCFCNDEYILDANRKFINHDYYTDVITFDYTRHGKVGGDIILSLDTVRTNAVKFGTSYERELLRVIIHGVLHLCGINDKGPGEREIMENEENKALAIFDSINKVV